MDIPKSLNYRFYSYDCNFNAYSCDMLRLKFFIKEHLVQRFLDALSNLQFICPVCPDGIYVEYYRGRVYKIGSYKHLFTLKPRIDSSWSVSLGISLVTAESHPSCSCMVEFNPNKCDAFFTDFLLNFIAQYIQPVDGYYFQLSRFDLAVDVAVPRSDVMLVKTGKRAYHRIVSGSVTEYSGCRNTNGFVKVYDKGHESELDYDLTRIEITCDNFDIIPLPHVCIFSDTDEDLTGLTNTDRVLLRLLRDLDYDAQQQALIDMGYCKARKLKQYLFPRETEFAFDMTAIDEVIRQIKDLMEMWCDGHKIVELRQKLTDKEWCNEHEKDGEKYEARKKYNKLRKLVTEVTQQSAETGSKADAVNTLYIRDGGDIYVQLDFSDYSDSGPDNSAGDTGQTKQSPGHDF